MIAELPSPVRLSAQVTFNLSEDEWVALVHEAHEQGITLSALLRSILRERRRQQLDQSSTNPTS